MINHKPLKIDIDIHKNKLFENVFNIKIEGELN